MGLSQNYATVSSIVAADLVLFFQQSSGLNRNIEFSNMETSLSLPNIGGLLPIGKGGTGVSLASPGTDSILFWDQTFGAVKWLAIGAGLQIVGAVLSAPTSGGGSGGGGAPVGASFITQLPNADLTNEFALSTLATGLLKSTTTTGVLSIAIPGIDYLVGPGGSTDKALVRFNGTTGGTFSDSNVALADAGTSLVFSGAAGLTAGGTNQNVSLAPSGTGFLSVSTGIKTGAPTGPASVFRFGQVATGSVTLDTAHYVEVLIDGSLVKLLKSA
jgi:hypothetical protein